MDTLTEQLRRAVRESGLSGYELAKRSGVSQAIISRTIRGKTIPSMTTVDRLAVALGLALVRTADDRSEQ